MGRLRRRPTGIEAGSSDGVLVAQQLLSELQFANSRSEDDRTSYDTRPRPRSSPLPGSNARYRPTFDADTIIDESPPLFAIPGAPASFQAPDSSSLASDKVPSDEARVSVLLEPSSSIASSGSRAFLSLFTSAVEPLMIGFRKVLSHACYIVCIIQFAPILLPAFALDTIYRLSNKMISSTRFRLALRRRAILQSAVVAMLGIGAVTLMGEFKDGEPPSWSHLRQQWGDDFLLRFEHQIDEGCGQMGRRLMELHSEEDGLHPSLPRCVPRLCPATLSFLDHPNPYLTLGFDPPPHAQPLAKKVIAKAYHSLVLTYHPDKIHQHHLPPAKSAFILRAIHRAGKILLDDGARAEWDRQWLGRSKAARFRQSINRARRDIATGEIDEWDFWDTMTGSDVDEIKHHWGRKARVGQGGWWEIAEVGAWWMLWWWDRVGRGLQWGWRLCSGSRV